MNVDLRSPLMNADFSDSFMNVDFHDPQGLGPCEDSPLLLWGSVLDSFTKPTIERARVKLDGRIGMVFHGAKMDGVKSILLPLQPTETNKPESAHWFYQLSRAGKEGKRLTSDLSGQSEGQVSGTLGGEYKGKERYISEYLNMFPSSEWKLKGLAGDGIINPRGELNGMVEFRVPTKYHPGAFVIPTARLEATWRGERRSTSEKIYKGTIEGEPMKLGEYVKLKAMGYASFTGTLDAGGLRKEEFRAGGEINNAFRVGGGTMSISASLTEVRAKTGDLENYDKQLMLNFEYRFSSSKNWR